MAELSDRLQSAVGDSYRLVEELGGGGSRVSLAEEVDANTRPNGMDMEGRLPGCQNCHLGVRANDYLFTGQLGGQ